MRSKSHELKCKALGDGGRQSGDLNSHGQPPKAQHQSVSLIPSEERLRHDMEIGSRETFNCKRFGCMYMRYISTCPKEKVEHFDPPEGLVLPLSSIMISASRIYVPWPPFLCSSNKSSDPPNTNRSPDYNFLCIFANARKNESVAIVSSREKEGESWKRSLKDRSEDFVV